jgi:hypothetical protein
MDTLAWIELPPPQTATTATTSEARRKAMPTYMVSFYE